ncbi:MAG: c-type cytochrome [Anaerolineales bacterium]|nr:c-type cytochrome [Anaerolineales bacterium]
MTARQSGPGRRWGLVLAALGAGLLCGALALPVRPSTAAAAPAATRTPVMLQTPDRLKAPPTVEHPSQADTGAQVFWLNCQPCHGDQGQGLTDEWRAQYPPEDQNCWESRCHGDRPYDDGFTLPHVVPAVIGPGSLSRFASAADLHTFISAAMPFQAPGSLSADEYWALTAFLLRAHAVATPNPPLASAEQAALIGLHGPVTPPAPTPTPTPPAPPLWQRPGGPWLWLAGLGAALVAAAALLRWARGRAHGSA